MDTFKIEGIVLQTTDFGDANRVVTIFSREFGKLEANAYGCRRARNPMSGAMQMFNHISAEVTQGLKVDTIRDADIIHFYGNLTADIDRLAYAALFFEIVNKMTLPKLPEINIFNLILKALPALNERNPEIAALIASCQFMEFSGIQLNFERCVHCGNEIVGDAVLSFADGGAVCKNCLEPSENFLSYPENLRLTFQEILMFDWKKESRTNFNLRQIRLAEKIFLAYVHSIIGKELNAVNFIRQLKSV